MGFCNEMYKNMQVRKILQSKQQNKKKLKT